MSVLAILSYRRPIKYAKNITCVGKMISKMVAGFVLLGGLAFVISCKEPAPKNPTKPSPPPTVKTDDSEGAATPAQPTTPVSPPKKPPSVVERSYGSCQQKDRCTDYKGSGFKATSENGKLKKACEQSGGEKYSAQPCPSENRLHSCYAMKDTYAEMAIHVYKLKDQGGLLTLSDLRSKCFDVKGTLVSE